MAEAQLCGLQDEFTCSVCLDTLTDPVTIPCGHNFCLKCLTDCWKKSQESNCPQCRENFTTRPALRRNNLLNEVIKKLKKTTLSSPSPQNYAGPGDVECDFCNGKKFRAVKSCLTCMASYCQTHLQPHYEGDALKHHKLADPDRNLKEKLCEKHQKSLEIFCKTDETCICLMCVVTGHKNHEMVELEMEREEKQKHLGATLRPEKGSVRSDKEYGEDQPGGLHDKDFIRKLRLSEGNKKVTWQGKVTKYPDHPDRFDFWHQVLFREALTGTRCYWEVECSGDLLRIGVAYKGQRRKGGVWECVLGNNDKSWCLLCSHSQYSVIHNYQQTVISAPHSPRIGVYLDWPAGSLSFYSVSHTMTLLHRFNTSFTEPLYPGFYASPADGDYDF
ncbi:tripartite motif-containing protein 16-like [Polypterus senegalus]|uniref:tripartite motif-containing protein 16-like n=1 Tax=Polypterus senegalus TaxID=55291 RepID=UPI0019637251|nr:tripartite motif-containing protein 16-like [Polypterus senegalus]